jgi:hypothetical protein
MLAMRGLPCPFRRACFKAGQASFDSRTLIMMPMLGPDKPIVQLGTPKRAHAQPAIMPWALEIQAASSVEPSSLVRSLTGAILGCGGWVLTRSTTDTGRVNILFEFERAACVEVYTAVIACGIELSRNGHIRMTDLCHCTRNQLSECGGQIASMELEIQTNSLKIAGNNPLGGSAPEQTR